MAGIFEAETITDGSITGTIIEVYGLRGVRDRTLISHLDIDWQLNTSGQRGLGGPTYENLNDFMFSESMVVSTSDTNTFRSHNVYAARLPLTTLDGAINDSVETIVVADATNFPSTGTIQIGTELIDYVSRSGTTLTCTGGRGAHSTSPASHSDGVRLDSVRWAVDQDQGSGYRIMDSAKDYQGTSITIGDIANYPNRKNNISPPTEVTLYKT